MILHVDMDAFYASIEIRDRPELADKPVVVGRTPEGRGVVCAANYIARRYGIHSAMPAATAVRLCPAAEFLPPRMGYYLDVSQQITQILERYTPQIEPLSLDEAFLDVAGTAHLFGTPLDVAGSIRRDIKQELNLIASVGVAPIKFVAKIASDLEKPDGLVAVAPDEVQDFLDPLPVERIWGVGKVARKALDRLHIRTIRQLRRTPPALLEEQFGKVGRHLSNLAHGIDNRLVVPDHRAKSISQERTFHEDISDQEVLAAWLLRLTEQVTRRCRRHRLQAGVVQLKMRFSDFRTITRSRKLRLPSNITNEIWEIAQLLLTERVPQPQLPVRLLGLGVTGFEEPAQVQTLLFESEHRAKQQDADGVGDEILKKFGSSAIRRGATFRNPTDK